MFDDLHDPDPPRPGLDTLAAVSERARRLRRRRSLLVGGAATVAVVALVAGVASFIGGDDDERLVGIPADSAAPTPVTTSPTPTPTSVPATEPTPASSEASVETMTVAEGTEPPPSSTVTTVPGPAAGERPVVAVDGAGDAVYLPVGSTEPVLLHDGTDPDDPPPMEGETVRVDGVAVLADESAAFVGICCEPVAGSLLRTVPPAAATFDSIVNFGTAPVQDPSGTRIAAVAYYTVVVLDADGAQLAWSDEMDVASTPIEVAWLDDTKLVVLSVGADGARLHVFGIEGGQLVEQRQAVIADTVGEGTFPRLAGVDDSIFVVGIEPDALVAFDRVTLERSQGSLGLPGPALTAWFDGEELVWVDTDRVLHVGDVVIPGEYIWARR